MSWRRDHYQKKKNSRLEQVALPIRDGKDLIMRNYVFRTSHFFPRYRMRVKGDDLRWNRTDKEIAEIATHSFSESEIPKKLGIESRVLVRFHIHYGKITQSLGLFYVPMRRDKFDLESGRICAITLLDAEERYNFLQEKKAV
jgi:hypothetical protein